MQIYRDILKEYWGYDDFRPLQGDIIESVGAGNDTLGLMPTGGGKSITFQVPALAKEGLCLVVTPLIALMKDQVENLRHKGIKAAMIYSGMSRNEILTVFDNCLFGDYKFLYVSPERIGTEFFLTRVKSLCVNLIAVDESHCISQWGYDFRPSYLKIAEIRDLFPDIPILALTATATPDVVDDIQEKLKFREKCVFKKSFERKNLAYVVRKTEDKLGQLINILHAVSGTSVVYVRSRKKTKEIYEFLNANGISSDYFHAGLSDGEKDIKQKRWKCGDCRVIVATNAFGMGIDKADVRTVVHIDLPDSMEAYFQEAGRAGRDGEKAYAVLLYNNTDEAKLKKRIADNFPEKERILNTYDSLGNYLELGVGFGLERVYAFNLRDFCARQHLPINSTYSALKILELSGYIELTEELDNPSKLMFTVKKEELYTIKELGAEYDNLMQSILRSYTGVFSDAVHIDEELIANRVGLTRNEVYDKLVELNRMGIVSYIPFRKTPFLIFTQERQERKRVVVPPSAYDYRKNRYEKRVNAMLDYAKEENQCRSRVLLHYFGEKDVLPCGQCDVCLKKKQGEVSSQFFKMAESEILKGLEEPQTVKELLSKIKLDEDRILDVLRRLMDEGIVVRQPDMKLRRGSVE